MPNPAPPLINAEANRRLKEIHESSSKSSFHPKASYIEVELSFTPAGGEEVKGAALQA